MSQPRLPRVYAIDAGAHGGLSEHWRRFERWLDVDAFEPNSVECQRLNRGAPVNLKWHARGLARRTGSHKLYVLNRPTGSSLYPPNEPVISRYSDRSYWGLRETLDVDCTSLDDFLREGPHGSPHLLKLDTQGSELDILQGMSDAHWPSVLGAEIEVEFAELYAGQPLFPDVHRFMLAKGFELFDLRTHRAYRAKDGTEEHFLRRFWNFDGAREQVTAQLVAGDALYLRPLDRLTDRDTILRFMLVTTIYHCYELSLLAVEKLEREALVPREEIASLRQFIVAMGPKPGFFDRQDKLGTAVRLLGRVLGRKRERRVFWTERVLPDQ
jgi:FkbM family methyltransferase